MPLALVLSILAAADARVSAAIDRYEVAQFAVARDALIELVDAPGLSKPDRAEVRTYLAACYLALGDKASARLTLRALEKDQPEARPSPATFTPEFNLLVNDVWTEGEKRRAAEVPAVQPQVPVVAAPRVRSSGPPQVLAAIPLGIGHIARGDTLQGLAWLAVQAVLFGVALGTVTQLESIKLTGTPLIDGTYDEARRGEVNTLNAVSTATFFGGLAVAIVNVIVAFATWPGES